VGDARETDVDLTLLERREGGGEGRVECRCGSRLGDGSRPLSRAEGGESESYPASGRGWYRIMMGGGYGDGCECGQSGTASV
jgi:hypothetical protein